jgi:hypothetical protein
LDEEMKINLLPLHSSFTLSLLSTFIKHIFSAERRMKKISILLSINVQFYTEKERE